MVFKLIEAAQPDGAPSTHLTSSLWYAPEPDSRTANSSNDPTNQEVISKLRDRPIHGLTIPRSGSRSSSDQDRRWRAGSGR
jgi:hypothetical protein